MEIDIEKIEMNVIPDISRAINCINRATTKFGEIKIPTDPDFGELDLSALAKEIPELKEKCNQIKEEVMTIIEKFKSIESKNLKIGDSLKLSSGIKYFETALWRR